MMDVSVLGHQVDYPKNVTLLDFFNSKVIECSQKIAVRYGREKLTYQELNAKANALAAQLHAGGMRKGDIVPVIIGNSLELPIAWLSLVKLGAVFVPFDPDWPVQRLQTNLAQIGSQTILVNAELDGISDFGSEVIKVHAGSLVTSDYQLCLQHIVPDDLIYGFFTSGSTGRPKCALNRQRGIFNRFHYMAKHFDFCQPKTVLLNSRHVFDPSVWQILWTLTVGGEVVIPEKANHLDLAGMIDIIHERSITMTDFVPSIFNALVEMIDSNRSLVEKLSSLQCLLIGGEAINVKTVNKFRRLLPNVHLTNTYGPTEASIGMVFHDVSEEDDSDIPLGLPIDNTFLAILDERLEPVPSGEVGEIFIGGECLGSGYLGDSQKTDAAFIANPIPAIPGDKLYRTGDLGRLDSRGRVCFCGRIDNQTKVNGVRIELGEIEHALLSHEQVNEAVVVSIEKGALHTKKLCAFVISRNSLSADILKRYLSTLLPEYMLPNEYVFCLELPLTSNGKVDRQSLVNSLKTMPQNGAHDESISSVEKELLNRFRSALSADRLGIDDNFFEFGGDSLSALEVALGAGVDSRIDLEVGDIYAWPTVRDLATGISQRGAAESKSTVNWELESQLANDIKVPHRSTACSRPNEILITGATGFVGAHLLYELLQSTSAQITALVRDGDSDAATRCRHALAQYGLWREVFAERLVVVPGDLSKPNLGLEPATWNEFEKGIDSIVHCGAMVDLLRSYSQHRPHNVVGTMEVIRLATSRIPKHLHYVSTLSVFEIPKNGNGNHSDLIRESDVPTAANLPFGGYQQSKSVAENLVRKVESNGLSATIYRLGEIGPSSETGLSNNKSFINLLLNGCVRLGVYPTSSFSFDWTPVDAVAKAMAYCISNGLAAGETFHVMQQSSISFRAIIDCLVEAGMPLRLVTHPDLCMMLEDVRSTNGSSDLTLLRALLPPASGSGDLTNILVDAQRYYRRDSFERLLHSSTISFPEHDERTLAARFVHSNTVSKLAAVN